MEKKQYAWFVALFLHAVMPWFVNACEVSLMSNIRDIAVEDEGTERERRRGRRTRQLDLGAR